MQHLLDALGKAMGPTNVSKADISQLLEIMLKYVIYERSEDTVMSVGFANLVKERHEHFHLKANQDPATHPWNKCSNDVCTQAVSLLAQAKAKEVFLNPIAAQLMLRYKLNFMPLPGQLKFWITKQEDSAAITEDEKRQAGRIILAS